MRNAVSWNICTVCNYQCSYCVQKKSKKQHNPSSAEIDRFLAQFEKLEGRWEFKISGGEPFMVRELPRVAAGLREGGHYVSMLTNLSSSLGRLGAFIDAAAEALRTFSCSLHLEVVGEDAFLEKALKVKALCDRYPRSSFVVNSVVAPHLLPRLPLIREKFVDAGIKFYPQLMRIDGKNYCYSGEEWALVERLLGRGERNAHTVNMGYSFTGLDCLAGTRYFILSSKGEAYRCYPGKRFGDGKLGNMVKGTFALWADGPRPCPYDVCPCTVPINRGMVDSGKGRRIDHNVA